MRRADLWSDSDLWRSVDLWADGDLQLLCDMLEYLNLSWMDHVPRDGHMRAADDMRRQHANLRRIHDLHLGA